MTNQNTSQTGAQTPTDSNLSPASDEQQQMTTDQPQTEEVQLQPAAELTAADPPQDENSTDTQDPPSDQGGPEGEEETPEQPNAPEPAPHRAPPTPLPVTKVVITVTGPKATVALKRTDTDVYIQTLDGLETPADAIIAATDVLNNANLHWETQPKHPLYTKPKQRKRTNSTRPNNPPTAPSAQNPTPPEETQESQSQQAALF